MNRLQKMAISLALATVASTLFYREVLGINCLLFTLASIPFVLSTRKQCSLRRALFAFLPPLLSATMLVFVPQQLSYIVWISAYFMMWTSISLKLQPILIPLQSLYSLFARFLAWVTMKGHLIDSTDITAKPTKHKGFAAWMISGTIVLFFLILYASSNPVFSELLTKIDLSFIDFGFIMTTLFFAVPLFCLLFMRISRQLVRFNHLPIQLKPAKVDESGEQEYKIARISTWGLVVLLGILNLMDIVVLISGKLPAGMTYADFLHQGFYTLIFSICLAIALLIYFFRNQLNFHKNIHHLRMAATAWVIQNAVLALLTAVKNYNYISMYGLTYKRIAVAFCLISTLIGLLIALKKIYRPTTNWQFFNRLSKAAFVFGVVMSVLPYDQMITHYNLDRSRTFDIEYLSELEHPDWMAIQRYMNRHAETYRVHQHNKAKYNINRLKQEAAELNWPSWSYYLAQYREE